MARPAGEYNNKLAGRGGQRQTPGPLLKLTAPLPPMLGISLPCRIQALI